MPPQAPQPSPFAGTRLAVAEARKSGSLFRLAVGVVIVAALYLGQQILVPITLAVLLAFLLAPLVNLLRRWRVPRSIAVGLSVALALVIILLVGGLIGSQVADLTHDLPRYESTIKHKYGAVRDALGGAVKRISTLGHQEPAASPAAPSAKPPPSGGAKANAPSKDQQQPPDSTLLELGQRFLEPIVSPLGDLAMIFIVTIFILVERHDLRDRLIRLFGSGDVHGTTRLIDEAGDRLSRYFLTQAAINTMFGVIVAIGLSVIGVPNPVLWGVLALLLRFIPYVGSITAGVLPVAVAVAVDPGWSMAAWTAALFIITEGITGQFVEPLVYGRSTGLSPLAVILGAIFWGWIWGPIGLLLSTPITLCIVVLGRHIPHLEFFEVLLGDQPALTPAEAFYQRLLAGDPDEILEQAETRLKELPLASYYDEVAVPALRLAAEDIRRGAIAGAQVKQVQDDIGEVIRELESHDEAQSAPTPGDAIDISGPAVPASGATGAAETAGPSNVLCIAGRDPLDESVASILAQLLRKQGRDTFVIGHDAVSRAAIERLDAADVAIVCVCCLSAPNSPSFLRFLMRRLRSRLTGRPIVVGLWPPDGAGSGDTVRKTVEADRFVGTLAEAVASCIGRDSQASPGSDDGGGRRTQLVGAGS